MSRAKRLERLNDHRTELEAEYEAALISALRKCASGSWGLFDHNKQSQPGWEPIVKELCDLGQQIDEMRLDLAMEPFALHQEFEDSRGPVPSNAPGEPKQAQAWLDKLRPSAEATAPPQTPR